MLDKISLTDGKLPKRSIGEAYIAMFALIQLLNQN